MEYYSGNNYYQNRRGDGGTRQILRPRGASMARASMILGMTAVPMAVLVYPGMILGAMAIVTALLSRGRGKMSSQAVTGLVLGSVALIAVIVMIAIAVNVIVTTPGLWEQILEFSGWE